MAGAVLLALTLAAAPASAQDAPAEPDESESAPAEAAPEPDPPAADISDAMDVVDNVATASAGSEVARPAADRRQQIFVAAAPTSGVNSFHLVRQSSCQRRARWRSETAGCAAWLVETRAFGPKPVNSSYRLRRGSTYYLVPVCRGRLDWRSHTLANSSVQDGRVELRCAP